MEKIRMFFFYFQTIFYLFLLRNWRKILGSKQTNFKKIKDHWKLHIP